MSGRNKFDQTIEAGCRRCGWKQDVGPGEPLPDHVCPWSPLRVHPLTGEPLPSLEQWREGGRRCPLCREIVPPQDPHLICPLHPRWE